MTQITVPDLIPVSWKSTLIGIVGLVLGILQASSHNGDWVAALHDRSVQLAIAVAILGFVSKDSNVTGGTSGQPSTAQALADANQHPSAVNPPKVQP